MKDLVKCCARLRPLTSNATPRFVAFSQSPSHRHVESIVLQSNDHVQWSMLIQRPQILTPQQCPIHHLPLVVISYKYNAITIGENLWSIIHISC